MKFYVYLQRVRLCLLSAEAVVSEAKISFSILFLSFLMSLGFSRDAINKV